MLSAVGSSELAHVRARGRHRLDGAAKWWDDSRRPPAARVWRQPGGWDPSAWRHSRTGAGDEVIMSIAGHVSRTMLSRYYHVRMEAKRRARQPQLVAQQTDMFTPESVILVSDAYSTLCNEI